jgi:hypothetical protein
VINMQIPFPRVFVWASAIVGVFVLAWDLAAAEEMAIPLRLHGILLVAIVVGVMIGTAGILTGVAKLAAADLAEATESAKQVLRETASLRDEVWELNRRLRGGVAVAPAFDVVTANDPRLDGLRDRLARRDEDV